ncbi:MAG: hypothetical protein WCK02_11605 [Bacteroidota bacterium]
MQLKNLEEKLIIAVVQHKSWDYILVPYIVAENIEKMTADILYRLTAVDYMKSKADYSPEVSKILKTIYSFDDNTLMKAHSKSNFLNEFLDKTSKPITEKVIRPYIEKKIADVIPLIIEQNIPFFFKSHNKTLYYEDEIKVAKDNAGVIFNFNKTENGTEYFLNIKHDNKEISLLNKDLIVLSNDPSIIILGNILYNFADIDSKKLLPFLTKEAILVAPQNEKAYYDTYIRKVLHSHTIKHTGFSIVEEELKKQAKLSIEKNIEGKIVLILKYHYDGASYFFDDTKQNKIVDFSIENEEFVFTISQRDLTWEKEIIEILGSNNFVSNDNKTFKIKDFDTDKELVFIEKIAAISNELADLNLIIKSNLDKKYAVKAPKIEFQIKKKMTGSTSTL